MLALSFDLCGKMAVGKDQGGDRCRYIMVACYTFLASVDGKPLIDHPGAPSVDKDQPLPSMDLHGGGGLDSKTINLCRRWTYTEGAIVFLKVNSK